MKIIIITNTPTTGNIVKGAFQQAKIADTETVMLSDGEGIKDHIVDGETVILVDWEDKDPEINAAIIKTINLNHSATPTLILATKQSSSSTFAGMKNGAKGIITKPIDPEQMIKAIANTLKSKKGKPASVNVEFINPFIESTKNVFKTMVNIDVERDKLYLKEGHEMYGDISGVMGLSGAATGSVVISLPKGIALKAVGNMLGEEAGTEITADTCDAVSELINMISGQAKASLTKSKYHFQISIPTVVQGSGHEITHKKGTPNVVVLFKTNTGDKFAIQVCLSPTG